MRSIPGSAVVPPPPPARHQPSPTLHASTVHAVQQAVRATLRLQAGLEPRWSWTGHLPSEFLRCVRGHHISGILAPHCAALGLPPQVADGIAEHADRVGMGSLAQVGWIRQVHDRLAGAGIPVIFFKGLAVEAQTGRQLGSRGGGDIDILVPVERLESAITALHPIWRPADGYPTPGPSWAWRHWRRWGSELPLQGPVTVDLHWKLRGVPTDLPDFPAAWASRAEVDIGGRAVPTLGLAHAVAHACRHAESDHWRILRSLVDIHLLLAQLSPVQPDGPTPFLPTHRAIGVVDRAIGLPSGWRAPAPSSRIWTAVLDEQRHLGSHSDRNSQLTRAAYLWRMLTRMTVVSRRPIHDALNLLCVLTMPPPHQLGRIDATTTFRGVLQGVNDRFRYERDHGLSQQTVGHDIHPSGTDRAHFPDRCDPTTLQHQDRPVGWPSPPVPRDHSQCAHPSNATNPWALPNLTSQVLS